MAELDLVVRGGVVVTASDMFRADVGVRDGPIAAVAEQLEAKEALDGVGAARRAG